MSASGAAPPPGGWRHVVTAAKVYEGFYDDCPGRALVLRTMKAWFLCERESSGVHFGGEMDAAVFSGRRRLDYSSCRKKVVG